MARRARCNEPTSTLAEVEALRRQLTGLLETLKRIEWGMSHNYRTDRFDVMIVGEENAAALRRPLLPELAKMSDVP